MATPEQKPAPFDRDVIHAELRDRICLRVYPPGTLLREVELATEFGVSRTPVREVLQRLSDLGLVEVRNGVGTLVRTYDCAEVSDIYALRVQVAALIGEMSPAPVSPAQVAAVEELRRQADALGSGDDLVAYWRINHAMHFIIGELIGNQALRRLWDQLYFQVAAVWYGCAESAFDDVAASLRHELDDVLRALHERDVAAVGFIQRNYIAAGFRRVQARFAQTDGADPAVQRGG